MLTTDTSTKVWTNLMSLLYGHLNELTDTFLIKHLERIHIQDLLIKVYRQEASNIVTTITKCHLSQVISTEREVLSFTSNCISSQGSTRNFNHRTNFEFKFNTIFRKYLFSGSFDNLLLLLELSNSTDQRNHNLRFRVLTLFLQLTSST